MGGARDLSLHQLQCACRVQELKSGPVTIDDIQEREFVAGWATVPDEVIFIFKQAKKDNTKC